MKASVTFDDVSPSYLCVQELENYLKLLDKIKVRCTFFVIPQWNVCDHIKQDFSLLLKKALDLGHEIALHGYKHSKNEFGGFYPFPLPFIPFHSVKTQKSILKKAMKLLERLVSVRPQGFRAPFYLYNSNTIKALSGLGFKYDSSETVFKPTHVKFFRIKWSLKCSPYKVYDLIEIPVTGDYTYNLKESNFWYLIEKATHDLNMIKSHGGVFVMNVHINKSTTILLNKFLQIFVAEARRINTDFVRLIDINA